MNIELVDERGKEERMPFLERQMVKVVLMCKKEIILIKSRKTNQGFEGEQGCSFSDR